MIPKPVNKIEKELPQFGTHKNRLKTMLDPAINSNPTPDQLSDLKKIPL